MAVYLRLHGIVPPASRGGVQRPMLIRPERPEDHEQVRVVNDRAFGQPDEGAIVDAVRRCGAPFVSLVAADADRLVGHILFTPVTLAPASERRLCGLGPMAVLPPLQRRGIGGRLVRDGLEACRLAGYHAVVVVGHPSYYPRFGFERARDHGLAWDHDVPDDAFMALALAPGGLDGCAGVVSYLPEFTPA